MGILQGSSATTITQAISGLQVGKSYEVKLLAARRGNYNDPPGQDFDILIDGTLLGNFRPTSTDYREISVNFTASGSSQTLKLVARNSAGGDHTVFIDNVRVSEVGVGSSGGAMKWVVKDHLGTPRIIADQTGSLAGCSRHEMNELANV